MPRVPSGKRGRLIFDYIYGGQLAMKKLLRYSKLFTATAGILLLLTGSAKFVSAFGAARILQEPDPVFSISFRLLFWDIGGIEVAVALVCLCSKRTWLSAGLVAWLATSFVVYRIGLVVVGYHRTCSCMGNLTDALHISPQTADKAMKIILAYLLVGSYATLSWLWRQHKMVVPKPIEN
jgi:Methylamine utilisation protein MauE